eukprot:11601635-Alexandrium_andersonii.AAC.1
MTPRWSSPTTRMRRNRQAPRTAPPRGQPTGAWWWRPRTTRARTRTRASRSPIGATASRRAAGTK